MLKTRVIAGLTVLSIATGVVILAYLGFSIIGITDGSPELVETVDVNTTPSLWVVESKFENRDPNVRMLVFSLIDSNDVELAIDSNDCLYIKTKDGDLKEAARVVWKCTTDFWGK